jgi:hypothetical protein
MMTTVKENGLFVPKEFLPGVEEVEIFKADGLVLIVPTTKLDPILDLENPVKCGVPDASEHHDRYCTVHPRDNRVRRHGLPHRTGNDGTRRAIEFISASFRSE